MFHRAKKAAVLYTDAERTAALHWVCIYRKSRTFLQTRIRPQSLARSGRFAYNHRPPPADTSYTAMTQTTSTEAICGRQYRHGHREKATLTAHKMPFLCSRCRHSAR
ncbi:hypothetical protein F442_13377 [Phytophthora nicotianae P10297]|uniref:Uncharacterized protein n=1 Tax=Phytophthora nicotianae P10297 TaxID=1317064 RepID=W2YVG9_PHYNI|nr:hypothetical protein F442_13377 [Phytophthora nicotianae P10297]